MRPMEAAEIWAAQHLGFSGMLLVEKQTEDRRLGTKKTIYKYIVSAGECTRIKRGDDEHPIYQRQRNVPTKTISVDEMEY